MRRKSRECAVQILFALDLNAEPVDQFLSVFWDIATKDSEEQSVRTEVRDFAVRLVKGTLKNKQTIDDLIASHSNNWRIDRMPATDRNILRMAVYELLEEAETPAKVVINEAIEIAKKFGTTDSAQFINGVLDSIRLKLAESRKVAELT